MAKLIAPSILSADFKVLGEQLREIDTAGAKIIHIDIMDGKFVPNISIGFPIIKSIRPCTDMIFDVHLMCEHPEQLIELAAAAGADSITVHAEACTHLQRTIMQIKQAGCKAGVALNPSTIPEVLEYVVEDLDMILLMTVNPGFGGQKFIPQMMRKITECREFCRKHGCEPLIELDGGITLENAQDCILAGADILVAGSSVFNGNISENVKAFNDILEEK